MCPSRQGVVETASRPRCRSCWCGPGGSMCPGGPLPVARSRGRCSGIQSMRSQLCPPSLSQGSLVQRRWHPAAADRRRRTAPAAGPRVLCGRRRCPGTTCRRLAALRPWRAGTSDAGCRRYRTRLGASWSRRGTCTMGSAKRCPRAGRGFGTGPEPSRRSTSRHGRSRWIADSRCWSTSGCRSRGRQGSVSPGCSA